MPHVEVNGARIFYRAFGDMAGSKPPVLLIHGATVDGATDWGALAPVLGLGHRVIVPDCRGHGRSTNPPGTYTFVQLAADAAALIRALGHEKAHVVGHSNGGNVALVTLVEHPDVVASCVVQAGNAFVSPDLIEREPANFDPETVDREDPSWRDQMIRLHGRWHGREYWRTLLGTTVAEISSAPRYGPADLSRVNRPTLVIEGQNDRVNARSHHGEFIAEHVPFAELWRPAGVGHAVHVERPVEWLTRVEDFWSGRGTPARERVWRISRAQGSDPRTSVCELRVDADGDVERVTGVVLGREQKDALGKALGGLGFALEVRVLDEAARPALVRAGVTDVLDVPDGTGARLTQALFGERGAILDARGDFVRVRLERDGYIGWVKTASIVEMTDPPADASHRVWSDVASAHASPGGQVVGQLPFGARLSTIAEAGDWLEVQVEDGHLWWVRRRDARPRDAELSVNAVLARFLRFVGVPYLWGGRTPCGFDCSGLAQAFYDVLGVMIPRDADQQWAAGIAGPDEARPGDLLFFADPGAMDQERAAHVAIATGGTTFLHASGATGTVAIGRLDARDPASAVRLGDAFLGTRRFAAKVEAGS